MHEYQEKDLATCLKDRRVVFIGDSAIRHVFWATAKKLGFQEQVEDRHADFTFRHKGVTLEFIWDPFLNSSGLRRETMAASLSTEDEKVADTAAILLIGGGLWQARYLGELYMSQFKDSVLAIAETMKMQDEISLTRPASKPGQTVLNLETMMILAPVPVPVYELLTHSRATTMTRERIDSMNSYLQHLSMELPLPIAWSYTSMTANQEKAFQSDGLHVIQEVATTMADILLNLRCNAVLKRARTKAYPMDKTCCSSYKPPNWTQTVILYVSMGLLPLLVMVTSRNPKRRSFLPSRKITHAIVVLALAVCYCYYSDRTPLLNKVQKHYDSSEFFILYSIVFILGILSIRRSAATKPSNGASTDLRAGDEPFLSRHQTDEWKGWMQLIILIYHYTGASKVLWIYEIVRLLVASYLFLSGFGHTVFFYKKADYSLRRSAAVLIRLNMLSCILPYVMNTEYIFYYFAPLISFWYLVIYITMAIGHSRNNNVKFLLGKMVASAILVTALINVSEVFEMVFYILEKSCNIHWDVKEWRFRLKLDGYIVYVGMLCAILFIHVSEALRSDGLGHTSSDDLVRRFFNIARVASAICAITFLPMFFSIANTAASKQGYNSWVPYVSTLPILSFIVLRNFGRHFRNFHSSIFAWIGRHSLETFTLQFHIWLAADTKGLLALGITEKATGGAKDGRRVDMAILTAIFLWVCWRVAAATQTLTSWLIDPREGMEDIVDGEVISAEEEALSKTRSTFDKKRSSRIGRFADDFGAGATRSAGKIQRIVGRDLRVRLVIIVGVMWLLNIVSA